MDSTGWRLCFLPATVDAAADQPRCCGRHRPSGWDEWLAAGEVPAGTPFLLDPKLRYDVELNEFFRSAEMLAAARNTQVGYARDLSLFLSFLATARDKVSWRDATERDHLAYLVWRRQDPAGPRVSGATWDREVAAVNRFYRWQVDAGHSASNPIPQRRTRAVPGRAGFGGGVEGQRPATYSHTGGMERVQWLPARSYRLWRDVGIRGYTSAGLPHPGFRGRWAARNAAFCDLMVRTGLRLTEQTSLSVLEVPQPLVGGYQRFWLPPAIAKGGSARWVYLPGSVLTELDGYRRIDRAAVVDDARVAGRYARRPDMLVVQDPARPVATGRGGRQVKLSLLTDRERQQVLLDGPDGLEPAAFWLSEAGEPLTASSWKSIFSQANARCASAEVRLRAHPHLLRHTFAVITLEQLQRGHLTALAGLTPDQRGHYTRIFGDPLDWLRRQLGHRSVLTTQVYLHALQELEMETRMALVPDDWEDLPSMAALVEDRC